MMPIKCKLFQKLVVRMIVNGCDFDAYEGTSAQLNIFLFTLLIIKMSSSYLPTHSWWRRSAPSPTSILAH